MLFWGAIAGAAISAIAGSGGSGGWTGAIGSVLGGIFGGGKGDSSSGNWFGNLLQGIFGGLLGRREEASSHVVNQSFEQSVPANGIVQGGCVKIPEIGNGWPRPTPLARETVPAEERMDRHCCCGHGAEDLPASGSDRAAPGDAPEMRIPEWGQPPFNSSWTRLFQG